MNKTLSSDHRMTINIPIRTNPHEPEPLPETPLEVEDQVPYNRTDNDVEPEPIEEPVVADQGPDPPPKVRVMIRSQDASSSPWATNDRNTYTSGSAFTVGTDSGARVITS